MDVFCPLVWKKTNQGTKIAQNLNSETMDVPALNSFVTNKNI